MKKILIIEDDPVLRSALKIKLELENFEVREADNGKIGFEKAVKLNPDIILLDILLPEVDGIEFLKRYGPKQHSDTKIIVLSNVALKQTVEEAKHLGVNTYLIKPEISPKEVVSLIKSIDE